MNRHMRRILATLLIAAVTTLLLAACGTKIQTTDIDEQAPPDSEITEEADPENTDDEAFDKTYELSDLMWFDSENEEWVTSDFIPGAEKYFFYDDNTCEYVYKYYPTYDDMLIDSNYEIVTAKGTYIYNLGQERVSMMLDNIPIPVTGSIDGNQLIIEYDYDGSSAVRAIYTVAEEKLNKYE